MNGCGEREERIEPELTLGELDRDGALTEAIAETHGESRAEFLRKLALGSGALVGVLAAPPPAEAQVSEVAILNYGLGFEYLQSTFYTETERVGTVARMDERRATWARTLGAHERAHVAILRQVLGERAIKKPSFNFGGATETPNSFTRTAVAMEDLTVALLTGQTPRVRTPALLAAFFTLLTVEARHAAWARRIAGFQPVGAPLDQPKTLAQVDRAVASTGFVSTLLPRTTAAGRSPRFTG
ncbi:MAG TPA: ferritin-like domain-containing protein [Gaiellaceae bacterium]|nr:ferritin-like domain-containing protein [Gaiellaceae bacterium]